MLRTSNAGAQHHTKVFNVKGCAIRQRIGRVWTLLRASQHVEYGRIARFAIHDYCKATRGRGMSRITYVVDGNKFSIVFEHHDLVLGISNSWVFPLINGYLHSLRAVLTRHVKYATSRCVLVAA
jgi:hypothetical protein